MKKFIVTMMLASATHALVWSQSSGLTPVAAELFKDTKSKLTVAEKNKIAAATGFVLSGNKVQPFAQDKDSKDYPFAVTTYPTDMNKDGNEEVFIVFGNGYTSGNTGSSVSLFIRNAKGVYENQMGFPGMAPDALTTVSQGYPDLVVGGPGFEFPVFRWNGKAYANAKSISDAQYSKAKKTALEELSKQYQETLR